MLTWRFKIRNGKFTKPKNKSDTKSKSRGKKDTNKGIFQYKNSYIGSNSAVGNILNRLLSDDQLKQFSLEYRETSSSY
ncbi:DUF4825 domain-containing protein [Aneurinibacillus migulanus]|uniref:DUF4825 domain-containing protein n=1 Tax=Aneurinibacillus migulanus TaxID=47500 RepID=UPI002E1AE0F8|nr:DUF4825 domain-containing protein [Aneurinibacillus migulanus]